MNKNYILVNRKTGKVWRGATSRSEARRFKAQKGFMHSIVRVSDGAVIR